jgi:hypothetical protein
MITKNVTGTRYSVWGIVNPSSLRAKTEETAAATIPLGATDETNSFSFGLRSELNVAAQTARGRR